ncbi:MAG: hypothetical protein ACKOET_12605 [Verrucomicrobiota bacterium]
MNKVRLPNALALGTAIFLGTGCASIVDGRPKKISLQSEPTGATVKVLDAKGVEVASGTTPTTFRLKRGAGYFKSASYRVVVAKEGHRPVEVAITGEMNGWYFGNFLFGGLIGFLVIDPISGAMWSLTPKDINAVLPPGTSGAIRDGEDGLRVVLRDSVPAEVMARATPLVVN